MRKTLSAIFAAVAIGGIGGGLYHADRAHPHGFFNPHHSTFDAVAEAGHATPDQQRVLVEAALQASKDTKTGNVWALTGAGGFVGFSITRRRRRK